MDDDKLKIELTGNPFVDTGIGVIGVLAGIDEINQLNLSNLKSVFGDGSQIADWNSKFKSFPSLFTNNNPLWHTQSRRKGLNIVIYKSTLKAILSEVNGSKKGPRCWACGTLSDFDLAEVYKKAVESVGGTPPKEDRKIGRDFFPLAGSLGSDAQSLPSASCAPNICPKCLFAVQYLPLGIRLIKGYDNKGLIKSFPSIFQSTSIDLWYGLLKCTVNEVKSRAYAGNYETLGKKDSNFIATLLAYFERLHREQLIGDIPKGTNLYIWRFNNFGDSADCIIDTIPNPALEFLWKAVDDGLRYEIDSLVSSEGKNLKHSLYQCILDKRDYSNLYPEEKKKGASPKLYALYQTHICNHSISALKMAHKISKNMVGAVSEKGLKNIQRPEAFKEEKARKQFQTIMVRMAEKGEFKLEDYLDLFPLKESQGIMVEWDGWKLVRFYLHHTKEDDEPKSIISTEARSIQNSVVYYSAAIYNQYISERGEERFQREVLGQMKLGKVGSEWLRNRFVQLAELKEGFTYAHWSKLSKLDDGRLFVSELLFHMRLLWSQWVHKKLKSVDISISSDRESTEGLPVHIQTLIEAVFTDYVDRRGFDRFHRDILLRLRRKDIGLFWFKEKLTNQNYDYIQPLSEEEWEDFLINDEGQVARTERLFQLHLALANLYRVKEIDVNIRR